MNNNYTVLDRGLNVLGILSLENNAGNTTFWGDTITQQIADDGQNDDPTTLLSQTMNSIDSKANHKLWNHTISINFEETDTIGKPFDSGYYLLYQDNGNNKKYLMNMYDVTEDGSGVLKFKTANGNNSAIYDASHSMVVGKTFTNVNLSTIVTYIADFIGWSFIVNSDDSVQLDSYTIDDNATVMAVIQDLIIKFDTEVDAYVTLNGGRIQKRVIEFGELGENNGQFIAYGSKNKGFESINQQWTSDTVYTKLHVKGVNDATFASINQGNDYIVDDEANRIYNPINASLATPKYLETTITNELLSEPQALLDWANKQIQLLNHPRANYTVTTLHDTVSALGDSIKVQDRTASPVISLNSRVIQKVMSFASPETNQLTLGEFSAVSFRKTVASEIVNINTNVNDVKQIATNAKDTATDAKSTASKAKDTADSAEKMATNAQNSADYALSELDEAQTNADYAKTLSDKVQGLINDGAVILNGNTVVKGDFGINGSTIIDGSLSASKIDTYSLLTKVFQTQNATITKQLELGSGGQFVSSGLSSAFNSYIIGMSMGYGQIASPYAIGIPTINGGVTIDKDGYNYSAFYDTNVSNLSGGKTEFIGTINTSLQSGSLVLTENTTSAGIKGKTEINAGSSKWTWSGANIIDGYTYVDGLSVLISGASNNPQQTYITKNMVGTSGSVSGNTVSSKSVQLSSGEATVTGTSGNTIFLQPDTNKNGGYTFRYDPTAKVNTHTIQLTGTGYTLKFVNDMNGTSDWSSDATVTAGKIASTSTRASKINIDDISNDDIDRILSVNPRTFNKLQNLEAVKSEIEGINESYTESDLQHMLDKDYGFVIEELQEVGLSGSLFSYDEDGNAVALAYDRLTALLLGAIKRQQSEKAELELKVAKLETQVAKILEKIGD